MSVILEDEVIINFIDKEVLKILIKMKEKKSMFLFFCKIFEIVNIFEYILVEDIFENVS